tara:strand:- start:348 stop:695 length:348 start_codon:yes stop_codon:yes gene_type:complete
MASFIVYWVVNLVLVLLYAGAFVLFQKAKAEDKAFKQLLVVCGSLFFLASVIYTIVIAATENISEGKLFVLVCFITVYIFSIAIIGFKRKEIVGEITTLFRKNEEGLRDTRFDFI